MRVAILLCGLFGLCLADPRRTMRIVGGTPTTIDNYPFMCAMQFLYWGNNWFQACGGALISTRAVLSAAHCFYQDPPSSWRTVVGSSFASSGGTVHQSASIIVHERYDPATIDNDVAIVKLATSATLTPFVQLARIAGPNYNLPDGADLTIAGWGRLWQGGLSPEQLQRVDVNVINQDVCAERYAFLKTQPGYQSWPDITPGMLCAGILDVGGKDACQGDSGGPVFYSNIVVGVTSWGFGCADAYYPGVNARVSYYSDWIVLNAAS